jgi:tetratricopeptide (TPR) repeat protein
MSKPANAPSFVFDANFFISLKEIKAIRPYIALFDATQKLGVKFYVSAQVFNECPFIVGSNFKEFTKGIKIEMITDKQLAVVKRDLKSKGVRLLAQDPDLTLIALGKLLLKDDNEVFVVSDDYKLSQNIDTLNYRMKGLSLPAFVQFLSKNLKGKLRDYFKRVRKKILKLNLDFMLSRNSIYPAQAKIAWLIENAISVEGEGIHLNEENLDKNEKIKDELAEDKKIIDICEEFIKGRPLSKPKLALIKPYEVALKNIKSGRAIIEKAKDYLMKDQIKPALKYLRKANESSYQILQLMGTKLPEDQYQLFEKITASEISKISFLRAYILISAGKVRSALDSLDQTALFATMARISETVLTINFLKALLYVFNSLYNKAISQYKFIHSLANNHKKVTLRLKAVIGETVTLFLIGDQNAAFEQVQNALKRLKPKDLPNLMTALLDSGDYFLALGFPEIASNLYSVSLECAIDAKKKWRYDFILNKMKKAYMASALIGTETRPSGDISVLIDKFYNVQDVDTFNEKMTELALFTNKLYQPFEYFSKGKRNLTAYADLSDAFKEDWDCVKIQENPETGRTLLIGVNEDIGLVAFDVLLDKNMEGVPENYEIRLRKTAKIRIDPPDIIKETLFLIRAIITIPNEDRDLEVTRKIPIFFKQLQI